MLVSGALTAEFSYKVRNDQEAPGAISRGKAFLEGTRSP
jgi:hypothetical protein